MTEAERALLVCIGIGINRLLLGRPSCEQAIENLSDALDMVLREGPKRDAQAARESSETFQRTGAGEQA